MSIIGNMVGGSAPLKTVIIQDKDGNEFTGVVTDTEMVFDATPNDVKIGKVFASDNGVEIGTDTKTYRTTHRSYIIFPDEDFSIPLEDYDQYDYTKFQAIIAEFNTSLEDSTSVSKVSLNNQIFNVGSTEKISDIIKNPSTKSIDFNINNNTDKSFVVYISTYKEE